ncbi:MAG TPA: Mpo1-like protein [Gemmataceae bacterium]|nr:Mpo1-like protein [Gemmataceae bacterium]
MKEPHGSSPSPPLSWRRPLRRVVRNWLERHRHPVNLCTHLIGIPLAVAGVVLLFFLPLWVGLVATCLGYLLQYIGHWVEGNDVGEWVAVKRLLGRPYVSIAPRRHRHDDARRKTAASRQPG